MMIDGYNINIKSVVIMPELDYTNYRLTIFRPDGTELTINPVYSGSYEEAKTAAKLLIEEDKNGRTNPV